MAGGLRYWTALHEGKAALKPLCRARENMPEDIPQKREVPCEVASVTEIAALQSPLI
jgi:hypothetical protein